MAKAKGKEKPAASNVPADADVTDINAQQTPSDPVKTEAATETTIDTECVESKEAEELDEAEDIEEVDEDIAENSGEEDDSKENLEEEKEEEVKVDGTVEAAAPTVIAGDEKMEEGDKKEEVKSDGKVEGAPNKKGKKIKKKKAGGATASNNADKTENAAANKGKKKVDGMGLIFMCNSKTKQDCYQYKVLGLPESKKELVSSVYKGMRLFLYDIDLKLMYGIYKASSPGGYNLEPKAFKSAFPSQVRFTVLNDCIPLPEEKFKAAIKSNYFGRNRFNCELSPEQVKNLCKLFLSAGKVSNKQPSRFDGNNKRNAPTASNGGRDRRGPPPPRRDGVRREGLSSYQRRGGPAPPLYQRKAPPAYASPPPPLRMLAPPLYDRPPVDDYYYRRDPLLAPPREHIYRDVEMRPVEYHDPYGMRGEPIPFQYPTYSAAVPPPSAYAPPHHMYRY